MDYEEKYKEALERMRYVIIPPETKDALQALKETVFPELRESEDEKHRKWILEYLYDGLGKADEQFKDQFKAAIVWLEKQKDINCLACDQHMKGYIDGRKVTEEEQKKEQKPTPDWMPKFLDELRSMKHHFDYDEHRHIEGQILAIINWIAPNYFDKKEKEREPVPALDRGDEIVLKAICEELKHAPGWVERIEGWYHLAKDAQQPAVCSDCKEYDHGFERGREEGVTAGYNKAMKEMEQKEQTKEYPHSVIENAISFLTERNDGMPKDEARNIVNAVISVIKPEHWPRYRIQKPAEWSEEDEKVFKRLCDYLENERDTAITEFDTASFAEYVQWLEKRFKLLRPQPNDANNEIAWKKYEDGHRFDSDTVVIGLDRSEPRLVRCAVSACYGIAVKDLMKLPME